METKATDLTELFGSMVFNEDAMRQYLSSNSFTAPGRSALKIRPLWIWPSPTTLPTP